MMDWNLIKAFLAVCETGSQVRAAGRLRISHATVFRHISSLEEQTGSRLFERVNSRYVLTPAGQELRDISLNISQSFDEIDRRVAGQDGSPSGLVRLTSPRSFADTVLPRYLADITSAHPDIRIELIVSNQELNMADRSADIALRVSHAPDGHLWGRRILDLEWGIYASKDYLSVNPALNRIDDLPNHAFIEPVGQLAQHPAFDALQRSCSPRTSIACDDLTTMAQLACHGHGVALLPEDLRAPDLVRCLPFPAAPQNTLWLLTHPDLRNIHRISLVMKHLSTAFRHDDFWLKSAPRHGRSIQT